MMSIAELSQHALEHGNRLAAIETENGHCKAQHAETSDAVKEVGRKVDRIVWGVVTILATALLHLAIAIFTAAKK